MMIRGLSEKLKTEYKSLSSDHSNAKPTIWMSRVGLKTLTVLGWTL